MKPGKNNETFIDLTLAIADSTLTQILNELGSSGDGAMST